MTQTVSSTKVQKLDSAIYYALLGLALSLNCSIAGVSIFLSITFLLMLVRIYLKRDDLSLFKNIPSGFTTCFLAFVLISFLSGLFGAHPLHSTKNIINFYCIRLIPMVAVLLFIKDKSKLLTIVIAYFVGFTVDNLATLYNWGINTSSPSYHSNRAAGFLHIMSTAPLFAGSIPFLAISCIHYLKKGNCKLWIPTALALLISVSALLLSGHRGSWLAVAIGLFIVLFLYLDIKKFLMIISICSILVGGVFASSPKLLDRAKTITVTDNSNKSNYARILVWKSAIAMWKDYPVLGVGISNFDEIYKKNYVHPEQQYILQNAHSNVIHYMAERGTLGALSFLALWAYITLFSIKGWLRHRNLAYLGILSMYTGIMLHGLIGCNFDTAITARYMWTAFGVAFAWLGISQEDKTQQEETI